ncbi:MAG TPA: winged helix-turn-helix domain-containing protein [Thermoanaerobaculia bacterium]|nr:winged helix-turn-helix domain-containing protein [Thermoanaerobaculia bacterium]
MRLRFGELTFEGGRRLLLRGPDVVHVSPKGFQLLELLLARRPNAVSKAEIQEALWPRTFVSETNLPALVNEVRNALGDHAKEAEYVRTVHGFGYAFEAAARELPAEAAGEFRHVVLWGSQEIALAEGSNVVGRERIADVWIGHPSVSREHARITVKGPVATIEDLGSRNGTLRGAEVVRGRVTLVDGDEIRLGSVVLVYRAGSTEISTQSAI